MPNKISPEVALTKAIGKENTKILREQHDSISTISSWESSLRITPSWEYICKEIPELIQYFKAGKLEITDIKLKTGGILNFGYEIKIKNHGKFMLKTSTYECDADYTKYNNDELYEMALSKDEVARNTYFYRSEIEEVLNSPINSDFIHRKQSPSNDTNTNHVVKWGSITLKNGKSFSVSRWVDNLTEISSSELDSNVVKRAANIGALDYNQGNNFITEENNIAILENVDTHIPHNHYTCNQFQQT
jgi:hypothetical protein